MSEWVGFANGDEGSTEECAAVTEGSIEQAEKDRVPCPVCPQTFSRQAGLNRHIRTQHTEAVEEVAETAQSEREAEDDTVGELADVGIVELPQPAGSVQVGDWLLLPDGAEHRVTRKTNLSPVVRLDFGPHYWVTLPARCPVRKVTK